jgi:cyanophycin synthetase
VAGLDVAGVDVVAVDLSRPLEEQGAAVVEVNAGPGLRMHLEPSAGKPRPVGAAVVDWLFPQNATGRIPIVALFGCGERVAQRIADQLRQSGLYVGVVCPDAAYLDGRRVTTAESSDATRVQGLLLNPRVAAVVVETSSEAIRREGLGFDACSVAVVMNSAADPVAARVVVDALLPGGVLIVDADDSSSAALAKKWLGRVLLVTQAPSSPVVRDYHSSGGGVVIHDSHSVIVADGDRNEEVSAQPECSREDQLITWAVAEALKRSAP